MGNKRKKEICKFFLPLFTIFFLNVTALFRSGPCWTGLSCKKLIRVSKAGQMGKLMIKQRRQFSSAWSSVMLGPDVNSLANTTLWMRTINLPCTSLNFFFDTCHFLIMRQKSSVSISSINFWCRATVDNIVFLLSYKVTRILYFPSIFQEVPTNILTAGK